MMRGPGMMGGPHMTIESNGMAPNGRMMKEMGELMEKRGKELEQGK
jgi:hypothetical protein